MASVELRTETDENFRQIFEGKKMDKNQDVKPEFILCLENMKLTRTALGEDEARGEAVAESVTNDLECGFEEGEKTYKERKFEPRKTFCGRKKFLLQRITCYSPSAGIFSLVSGRRQLCFGWL